MKNNLLLIALLVGCEISSLGQVFINEVCPANADINYDPNFFNFSGWVELYNNGGSAVNVGGYFLSDDPSDKAKWQIPANTNITAKGHLLIWCDNNYSNLHTNFSLDSDGEELILSTSGLALVDNITFPKQYINISYGRFPDGAPSWSYLVTATPATKNVDSRGALPLDKPGVSLKSGRYSGAQILTLWHTQNSVTIRYTLDGTEPTSNSSKYIGPLSISKTTTVKAKAYAEDFLPSVTEVNTYFINEHIFTIPVVSLSTKPIYLWDNTIGIYTDGTNGIPGNCQGTPFNWNQDWDRHADFEYFKESGEKKFDYSVDIRIGGACSRGFPQKSFVVKARTKYGSNTIDEKIFQTKDSKKYGSLFLRNSGNDFYNTSFRDAMMQLLPLGQMDIDYMAYQPSALYLNGEYWGIQSLREKIDGDFIESNFGVDKNDVDLIETWENAIEGTSDAYWQYKDSLQVINLADPVSFKFIDRHIDVQEYINYLVAEIYYANTDWPGNNIKFWRQRSTNGKFRWILWDTDFGFALYEGASYATHPTLNFATDPNSGVGWPNPDWSTLHIRLVLQNPVFRNRFIQTLTTAMSTTFKPDRVINFIDSLQNQLAAEMPYHKQRWGGTMDEWNYEVQRLRNFAVDRNTFMQQHTADFFGLNERVRMSISTSPAKSGSFKLNGIVSDKPLVDGSYFKNLPYQVDPVPQPGFVFKNWKITKRESTGVPMINKGNTWKYFDQGASPGPTWADANFVDTSWPSGSAQLGYGDGDEATIVSYGSDANNKFITTYFRKNFTLADTIGLADITGSILFDDAAVIYLNGVEVYRSNMPAGAISYSTLSSQGVANENAFNAFTIAHGLLKPGSNVVAVEIHQSSGASSDIGFDLEMSSVRTGAEVEFTTNVPHVSDTAYSDVIMEAFFEPNTEAVSGIIINEFSAAKSDVMDDFNETEDWIELYNTGTTSVNLAGLYITDDITNKTKHKMLSGNGNEMLLEPGQYKVLWADQQANQGASHINFKLSADGEDIGLYQVLGLQTLALDEITFEKQTNNASSSRIPNATGPFILTSILTPGAENEFGEVTGFEEPISKDLVVYPNPAHDKFYIESKAQLDEVVLYDVQGKTVKRFMNIAEDRPLFNIDDIPSGFYIIRVRSGKSQGLTKLIKY